jgi:hypothetical protein
MIMPDVRYVAAVGCNHYFGFKIFKPGIPVRLEKDPNNQYDMEAIKVILIPSGRWATWPTAPILYPWAAKAPVGFMTPLIKKYGESCALSPTSLLL